ncbi:MAG: hypothetical protein IPL61_11405 [Myxococcales bacterium]|nr:hypothetical protein [Myxococcales bacterium]
MADDAGALLVRAGLIADQALASARTAQRHSGGTLGEHLVATGAVSDEGLTEFYRSRLMVPQVSPSTLAKLSTAVVALLPADMAVEFRVMPVSIDKDGNLTVAMSDPSDRHAVDEIGFFTGKYVVRAVATQMQIAWCLAHYYDYVTELAERLMQPVATALASRAAPAPAAPQPTRTKGDTAKVDAARHRVLVPATTPPPVPDRPGPESLDRSAPAPAPAPEPVTIEMESDEPDDGAFAPEQPLAPPPPRMSAPAPAVALAADAFGGSPTVVVSAEASRPQRSRPAAPDPPELAARSGEVTGHGRDGRVDVPSITVEINLGEEPELEAAVIALDRRRASSPPPVMVVSAGEVSEATPLADREEVAIIHDTLVDTESAPILLEHFRRGEAPPDEAPAAPEATTDEPSGPILLLERKKGLAPRRDKHTVLGIGLLGPIPRSTEPPPLGPRSPTLPPPMGDELAEAVPQVVTDEEAATRRLEVEPRAPDVDAGWDDDTVQTFGPPGTTIPPPYLGAAELIEDAPSGQIPLTTADADSAPIAAARPVAPAPAHRLEALRPVAPRLEALRPVVPRPTPQGEPTPEGEPAPEVEPPRSAAAARRRSIAPPPDPAALARQLEEASLALVDLLRSFDAATTRDHVIAMLIDFVASSHHRVAFLAAKGRELSAFMQVPAPLPGAEMARLDLTTPSTFQDVVGTRLPYRGPIGDAASRGLVKAMFGSPTDDILAVPVAVRDRVVGVIYADGRYRHSYDEHVTVGGRAAGLALERILKGKRH